jgi:SAM-dependent methyltransferase
VRALTSRVIREISLHLDALEKDMALREEANFSDRAEAIDLIETYVLDRIEFELRDNCPADALAALERRAESLVRLLRDVDQRLLYGLRTNIRSGNYTGQGLRRTFEELSHTYEHSFGEDGCPYDSLDTLVSSLLEIDTLPEEVIEREPEMIFYQPTPARLILELTSVVDVSRDDVFYDLGSGLGQVAILVNLLCGVKAKGIEVDPGYCDYARRCAKALNLTDVEFINLDARVADYSDGTIFYLYTPFAGKMLRDVLGKLEEESKKKTIRVCVYGPCILDVSRQHWLKLCSQSIGDVEFTLGVFVSV